MDGFTQKEAAGKVGMVVKNEQGPWGIVFNSLQDLATGEWLVVIKWSIAGGPLSFGSYPKRRYEEFVEVRWREEQVIFP
ncbi:MAG: hypothetical protein HY001_04360 [Candidatus Portnoybacteria bacterium]|nr:hypothetical protein [Candidatus Portnoybacteria bacterium]